MKKHFGLIALAAMTLVVSISLIRCGGGGGGDAPADLTYSGNTSIAVITLKNAVTLVANVLYAGESSANFPVSVSVSEEASRSAGILVQSEIIGVLSEIIRESVYGEDAADPRPAIGIEIAQPLTCDSGSGYLSGTLSDTDATGTLTFTFSNCVIGEITFDGTGSYIVDYFDFSYLLPTDVRIEFKLMSMSGAGFNGSASGTIRYQALINESKDIFTLNYVARDNLTGKMYKYEGLAVTTAYDNYFSPSTKGVTYTGSPARAYDSVHGYVDISTPAPLKFSSAALSYPDIDGVMIFNGAAGSSIRVTVLSAENLQLELDLDGISGYEESRILYWDELAVNVETDLTDMDSLHVLRVPVTGGSLTGLRSNGYFGQTFKLYEDATAERLTVYFRSGVINFRVLLVEVMTEPEFHPTNVLFESGTISVAQLDTPVTVDFGGVSLNAGQTYAWILDGYVEYDGTDQSSMIYVVDYLGDYSYPDGFIFSSTFTAGTREEHFADFWYTDERYDMSFILEYKLN